MQPITSHLRHHLAEAVEGISCAPGRGKAAAGILESEYGQQYKWMERINKVMATNSFCKEHSLSTVLKPYFLELFPCSF
ncbi:unnamed protein product [Gulo gulo]|uniref:Uncharacterized protein n=1 Tax=Gulo gulo TaxID=48420 RepID=A0A9X9Q7T7_GULGU|nr:unnamed protein product [Gulo gulo]